MTDQQRKAIILAATERMRTLGYDVSDVDFTFREERVGKEWSWVVRIADKGLMPRDRAERVLAAVRGAVPELTIYFVYLGQLV